MYIKKKLNIFYTFILFIISTFTYYEYTLKKETLYNQIDLKLKNSAMMTDSLFASNFHDQRLLKNTISKDKNLQNIRLLNTITNNSEITYIYTLIQKENKIYFTSSSSTKKDLNIEYFTYNKKASTILKNVFKTKKLQYTETSNKVGTFRSIYIPKQTKNGNWYIIGADIKISQINDALEEFLLRSIIYGFIFLSLTILFAKLFYDTMKSENKEELKKHSFFLEESKLSQMGEMIRNISHQWRQPLSGINSITMKMEIDFRKDRLDEEALLSHLTRIEELTQNLSDTIEEFNNFFKKDKEKKVFLISDVIKNSLAICKNSLLENNIKVELHIKDEIEIENYKGELTQAIIAIIQNAKNIHKLNKIKNPKIDITLQKIDNDISITFLDNGGGIEDKYMDKIFDANNTNILKDKGYGIGLYMSKMIIENSIKGKLSASNKQMGTEFKIIL